MECGLQLGDSRRRVAGLPKPAAASLLYKYTLRIVGLNRGKQIQIAGRPRR
jgi:hypothetical protein